MYHIKYELCNFKKFLLQKYNIKPNINEYFAFPPLGFVFKPEENIGDDNNDVNTDNAVSPNIYIFFIILHVVLGNILIVLFLYF